MVATRAEAFSIGYGNILVVTEPDDAAGLSCWGDNRNGQVGNFVAAKSCALTEPCTIDTPYHIDIDATRVVVGDRHTCVLGRDGEVTCFGSNEVALRSATTGPSGWARSPRPPARATSWTGWSRSCPTRPSRRGSAAAASTASA
jgi:hypothetical protein